MGRQDSQLASDIGPRVRHLEAEMSGIRQDIKTTFAKLDGISVALAQMQAQRPAASMMEGIKAGLSILQTLVLLVGAGVAAIVYVSSNANNADMALLKERIQFLKERTAALEQDAGWVPKVQRHSAR